MALHLGGVRTTAENISTGQTQNLCQRLQVASLNFFVYTNANVLLYETCMSLYSNVHDYMIFLHENDGYEYVECHFSVKNLFPCAKIQFSVRHCDNNFPSHD